MKALNVATNILTPLFFLILEGCFIVNTNNKIIAPLELWKMFRLF